VDVVVVFVEPEVRVDGPLSASSSESPIARSLQAARTSPKEIAVVRLRNGTLPNSTV
jgi:hypothetical protein